MKFYGKGIVWDATGNKILCKFVNGEFETNQQQVINKLKSMNFKFDEAEEVKQVVEIKDKELNITSNIDIEKMEYIQLRTIAKGKGINTHGMDKKTIINAIKKVGV
jgi:hypothetical protein